MSIDYLLTKSQQDAYDEQLEYDENAIFPLSVQMDLISKFIDREDDIEYIYYTGGTDSTISKYSLQDFMNEMQRLIPDLPTWPIMVALSGAGVVWKSKE